MDKVLTNGKIKAGAYMLPGMKKPHICYETVEDNCIHDCGRFNSKDSAERFIAILAELCGAERAEST